MGVFLLREALASILLSDVEHHGGQKHGRNNGSHDHGIPAARKADDLT